ncbi:50S ribosomal protein L29 [Candidatus Omnitrophota bacterium]
MIKASELRNLSKQELDEKMVALKKSLFEMRTQGSTGRIEKPSKISQMRKDIARILTVLGEKEKNQSWNPDPGVRKR